VVVQTRHKEEGNGKHRQISIRISTSCSGKYWTTLNNPRRLNKWAKPYKPSGLVLSHLSREPSPDNIPNSHFPVVHQSQTPRSISSASQGTHSRTPSLTHSHPSSVFNKPSGHTHIQLPSATMPVNDYGGFHEEDESVECTFALQHETRTTLNSEVLY